MKRIHFVELEDLPWFPKVLRDAATGFLGASHKLLSVDSLFVPKIVDVLQKTKVNRIVDLGSGGGGPTPDIIRRVRAIDSLSNVTATLTDFYPNIDAKKRYAESDYSGYIDYCATSIDATKVPKEMTGLRTMFLSFHHMPEKLALAILANAQESQQPIAIFEAFGRNIPGFIGLLPSLLAPFFIMPLVKPLKIRNLFFTYVIPLVPLVVCFDGWVSYLRIYSAEELATLVSSLPTTIDYVWEVGELGAHRAPYLVGYPLNRERS